MERRNFFKIAPFGLAGIAALTQGKPEPTGFSVMKAKQLTIKGADGKDYHPLVVAAESTTHEEVPNQVYQPMMMSSERLRVDNLGKFSISTTAPASKITFVSNGTETFRL